MDCMKRFTLYSCTALLLVALFAFTACESTEVEASPAQTQTVTGPTQPKQSTTSTTPKTAPKTQADLEYEKSLGSLASSAITKEMFAEDKAIILQKVEELDLIMRQKNYKKWVTYLDDESIKYWQNKTNLQNISSKLPIRGLKLSSLEDYFNYVFIGSRVGRTVDQIRYVTDSYVNAVQERDGKDIVYYTFRKVNGDWKVHLRTLEEM
ncbi:MAG TPA: hypothetical protein DCQ43_07470 [Treponema sp.]|nr:hypothetical protein [Treponema sp.]